MKEHCGLGWRAAGVFATLTLALAAAAGAAPPPKRPVTASVLAIDGVRIGGRAAGVFARKPDRVVRGEAGEDLQWGSRGAPRAELLRDASGRVEYVSFSGQFATAAGDGPGTTLAAFRRHHRTARLASVCAGADCATRSLVAVVSSPGGAVASFRFDKGKRLVGVELGRRGAYYVDGANGNDANTGLTPTAAWRTVQHALDVLGPGQTVRVRAGTYTESLQMKHSGTDQAPIDVAAFPGDHPVIQPPSCSCDTYAFQFAGSSYVRLRGFVLQNAVGTSAADVYAWGGAHNDEITGNEIRFSQDQGIFADNTTSFLSIVRNNIHDNGLNHAAGQHQSHGIYIEGGNHLIAGNVIHDQPFGFGIQIYPANHDTAVIGNTIVGNGHSGIVVGGSRGVSGITIRDNILAFNASFGLAADAACPVGPVVADHNVLFGNPGGGVDRRCATIDTSGGNMEADPLFVSYAGKDFHLQPGSPAIDAGVPGVPAVDVDGVARPQGAAPDIGAYEHRQG